MNTLAAHAWRIQNISQVSLDAVDPKYWQTSQSAIMSERTANTRLASRYIWVKTTTTPNNRLIVMTTGNEMMKRFVMPEAYER